MKHLVLIPALILCMAGFPACNETDESTNPTTVDEPEVQLLDATECKSFDKRPSAASISSSESCLEYSYDATNQSLSFRHVNAGFNCCPGLLTVQMTLEENIITIIEREEEAGCHCLCLYDLHFAILNLKPGSYRIVVIEPYLQDEDAALSFAVDLRESPSGKSIVPRVHYPWGI